MHELHQAYYDQNCSDDSDEIKQAFEDLYATMIVDRFGTKDVQYAKVDDTHFSVTAKVEISEQFFGWILGFGSKAKLVYPEDVMTEFSGYLDRIREMY